MPRTSHVAIIMDGNGRWANARSRPRIWGHIRGSSIVSDIVQEADELGIKALTLYAFSSENWSRPQSEISILFALLKKYLKRKRNSILNNNIRFKIMGDTSGLPSETEQLIENLERDSSKNNGLQLAFAFNYGARRELVDAVNACLEKKPREKITLEELTSNLYLPQLGDVDILIRTGGDKRISNFLLWQIAYAELFFTDTKWPDFNKEEFRTIYQEVCRRERRFGDIKAAPSLQHSEQKASAHRQELGA